MKKEQHWFAPYKRDLTDNTVTNPINAGRELRGTDLTVELENDYTGEVNLFGTKSKFVLSERTSK